MTALPPSSSSPLASEFAAREAALALEKDVEARKARGGNSPLSNQENALPAAQPPATPPAGPREAVPLKPNSTPADAPPVLVQPGTDLSALLAQRLKEDPELLDVLLGKKRQRKKRAPRKRPETDALPPDQWLALVRSYPDEETRALAALLFLCGPRITEALAQTKRDSVGRAVLAPDGRPVKSGFTRSEFWSEERDGHPFVVFRFVTLKRGDGKPRKNYVLADIEPERSLLDVFLSWAQKPERSKPNAPVFRFSRQNARNALAVRTIEIGATRLNPQGKAERTTIHDFHPHPHWFRHCRLTDLSDRYGFNEQQQRAWAGWKTTTQASTYTHLQSEGLATVQVSRIGSANRETTVVLIKPRESTVVGDFGGAVEEEEEGDEEDEEDDEGPNQEPGQNVPARELAQSLDGLKDETGKAVDGAQGEDLEDEYF